jgi:hypothetical protein
MMLTRNLGRGAVVFFVAAALGVTAIRADNSRHVTPERMNAIVTKLKPNQTMGWAKIPWAGTLVDARQVSRRENAPVFLFVLDGNLAAGRC